MALLLILKAKSSSLHFDVLVLIAKVAIAHVQWGLDGKVMVLLWVKVLWDLTNMAPEVDMSVCKNCPLW
ncbi:hypothetical protein Tco_1529789 [Tanacetum coccineum]